MKSGSVYSEEAVVQEAGDHTSLGQPKKINYVDIAESSKFKSLTRKKKKFILPMSIFFLVFYFMLPILTSYTNVLERSAFGDISWAWIYATAQFIMTWVLCTVYVKKFQKFDKEADDIIETDVKGGSY